MLDAVMRRLIDRPLDRVGAMLARTGLGANAVTLAGFVFGAGAALALAVQAYGIALVLILANRMLDGLDGAVARHTAATDLGAFLDIVCDFVFYSGVVFGFAVGRPDQALAAAFLIFSFVGTGATFLAFAILAAKRQMTTRQRGIKSFYYLGGLTEGTETILLFVAICLVPGWFAWLAYGFGALCWLTTIGRCLAAWEALGR